MGMSYRTKLERFTIELDRLLQICRITASLQRISQIEEGGEAIGVPQSAELERVTVVLNSKNHAFEIALLVLKIGPHRIC